MGASPIFKIYDSKGDYRAACKLAEDAACLVAFLGDGATIRAGHGVKNIVWREGREDCPAAESYDHVAKTARLRIRQWQIENYTKTYGRPPQMCASCGSMNLDRMLTDSADNKLVQCRSCGKMGARDA
jgi:hypothetical protein